MDEPLAGSASLSAVQLQRVDDVCDRFEAALRAGGRPSVADALEDCAEPERSVLARELRALLELYPERGAAIGETRAPHEAKRRTEPDVSLSADVPLLAPQRFGDYELLDKLGQGGMGEVFRARQLSANRIVVLKIIRRDLLADVPPARRDQWVQRFRAEAQAAAQMEHEHIVPVYQVGEVDGQQYYSMRFIDGKSLGELVQDGPLPPERAAAYLEPVARAVDHAHRRGILHRDLKPRNVIVDADDRPYVTDFGLAKWLLGEPIELTAQGALVGSPPYIAPEQIVDASSVTVAADVYSLGATLYHLLTGRPPFQAATVHETLRQVQDNDPVPPTRWQPGLSRDLETVCLKCLEKDPSRRYASAAELADDLCRYRNHQPVRARRPRAWERTLRWVKRRAVVLGAVLAAAVALAVTLVRPHEQRIAEWSGQVQTPQTAPDLAVAVRHTAAVEAERGRAGLRRGNVPTAGTALQSAVASLEELVGVGAATRDDRLELALLHVTLGDLLERGAWQPGDDPHADRHVERAGELLGQLEHEHLPAEDLAWRRGMARVRSGLGEGLLGRGERRIDLGEWQSALEAWQRADALLRAALTTQTLLATLVPAAADDADALACTENALARLQFIRFDPRSKDYHRLSDWLLHVTAADPWGIGRIAWTDALALPGARRLVEQAARTHEQLRQREPANWLYRTRLSDDLALLALLALQQRDHEAAAAAAERLPDVPLAAHREARLRAEVFAAEVLAQCVPLAERDAALGKPERTARTDDYGRRAVKWLRSAVAEGWSDWQQLRPEVVAVLDRRDDYRRLRREQR